MNTPAHNRFALDEFVKELPDDARIKLANYGNGMLAGEDFVIGLQEGLEREVGEASAVIMYQCGVEWGRQDMARFEPSIEAEFGRPMREMNVQFVLESWWWPLAAAGWGSWKVDMSRLRQGFIVVDLHQSAVAESLENVGKPVCHLYAGLLAGSLSTFIRRSLSCIEIQCYAMGEDKCRFLVGNSQRIDAAEFWLNEGARASEILRQLDIQ
jgi:predicted hydrocarbon binding protein